MAQRPARVRAETAVRSVATNHEIFRTSEVLDHPDAPSRRTVMRVLSDMVEREWISRVQQGEYVSHIVTGDAPKPAYGPQYQVGPLEILHVFADWGVESEVLATFGTVHRVGLNPRDTNESEPFECDARQLLSDPPEQIAATAPYDLVLLHPPCTKFADMTSISGDPDDHENLIPLAREIGAELGGEWIVENKPKGLGVTEGHTGVTKTLRGTNVVVLSGNQFNIPLAYSRAFEASFALSHPPEPTNMETEVSPYFYSDRSTEWWKMTKGYSGPYPKTPVAKSAVPAPYIRWLCREYLGARHEPDRLPARSSHNDPTPAQSD